MRACIAGAPLACVSDRSCCRVPVICLRHVLLEVEGLRFVICVGLQQPQDRNAQSETEELKSLNISSMEPCCRASAITAGNVVARRVCRRRPLARIRRFLTWLGAFNDPGAGAIPPMILLTSRAVHSRLNRRKRIKYYSPGVEPGGNRLPSSRTADEDMAFRALLGRRQNCVKRVRHVSQYGYGCSGAARGAGVRVSTSVPLCARARPSPGVVVGGCEFSGERFPRLDTRPVALCTQAISRLLGGPSASSRAKARAEHPGVYPDRVVDVDPHVEQ
jgi:hypothetical protein